MMNYVSHDFVPCVCQFVRIRSMGTIILDKAHERGGGGSSRSPCEVLGRKNPIWLRLGTIDSDSVNNANN